MYCDEFLLLRFCNALYLMDARIFLPYQLRIEQYLRRQKPLHSQLSPHQV